jgi:AraC-like DNA-binding protein
VFEVAINDQIQYLALQDNASQSSHAPAVFSTCHTAIGRFGYVSIYALSLDYFKVQYIEIFTVNDATARLKCQSDNPTIALNSQQNIHTLSHAGSPFTWEKGQFKLYINPGQSWTILTLGEETIGFWLYQLSPTYLQDHVPLYPCLTRLYVNSLNKLPYGLPYMRSNEDMLTEHQKLISHEITTTESIPAHMNLIIHMFTQRTFSEAQKHLTPTPGSDDPLELMIHAAAALINGQFRDSLRISTLAHDLHTNESTLKRGFRQFLNTTVLAYITERRLEEAVRLLITTTEKEDRIALNAGYSATASLIKRFKKELKCTPGSIRLHLNRPD